mmetsp:Transcript_6268/g.11898  ORF Transcript_6268/g.11898 Transcript_6268/m.11898 type:complete len:205 (-) Transcript_6268:558-1172(-)
MVGLIWARFAGSMSDAPFSTVEEPETSVMKTFLSTSTMVLGCVNTVMARDAISWTLRVLSEYATLLTDFLFLLGKRLWSVPPSSLSFMKALTMAHSLYLSTSPRYLSLSARAFASYWFLSASDSMSNIPLSLLAMFDCGSRGGNCHICDTNGFSKENLASSRPDSEPPPPLKYASTSLFDFSLSPVGHQYATVTFAPLCCASLW